MEVLRAEQDKLGWTAFAVVEWRKQYWTVATATGAKPTAITPLMSGYRATNSCIKKPISRPSVSNSLLIRLHDARI